MSIDSVASKVWSQIAKENEKMPFYSHLNKVFSLQTLDRKDNTTLRDVEWIKKEDKEYLTELFKKFCFTNYICFHDLMGLEFYCNLFQLKEYLPEDTWLNLRSEWTSLYLNGYFSLLNLDSAQPAHSINFFFSSLQYSKQLSDLTKRIEKELNNFQSEKELRAKGSKNRKLLQKIKSSWEEKFANWDKMRLLLGKLLLDRKGIPFLVDTPLSTYIEGDLINPQSEEEVGIVITNLKNYIHLIDVAQQEAFKRKKVTIQVPFVSDLKNQITALDLKKGNGETLKKCQTLLRFIEKAINEVEGKGSLIKDQMEAAKKDLFTHEQFCDQRNKKLKDYYSQPEFIEFLVQRYFHNCLFRAWFRDISRTIDCNIMQMLNSSHRVTDVYFNRMIVNLLQISESSIPQLNDLSKNLLAVKMSFLQVEFSKFSLSEGFQNAIDSVVKLEKKRDDDTTFRLLSPIYEDLEKQIPVYLKKFAELKSSYPQEWSTYPFLENTLWFSRLLLLFHDMGAMMRRKEVHSDEEIFPDEFLNLFEPPAEPIPLSPPPVLAPPAVSSSPVSPPPAISLPPISALPAVSPSPVSPPPAISPSPISTLPAVSPSPVLPPPAISPPPVLPPPLLRKIEPAPKAKTPPLPDPKELLRQTKKRKIEQILGLLGFNHIRTRGSHSTWLNPETGAQTVLPEHKELPTGTVRSIYNQVIAQPAKKPL